MKKPIIQFMIAGLIFASMGLILCSCEILLPDKGGEDQECLADDTCQKPDCHRCEEGLTCCTDGFCKLTCDTKTCLGDTDCYLAGNPNGLFCDVPNNACKPCDFDLKCGKDCVTCISAGSGGKKCLVDAGAPTGYRCGCIDYTNCAVGNCNQTTKTCESACTNACELSDSAGCSQDQKYTTKCSLNTTTGCREWKEEENCAASQKQCVSGSCVAQGCNPPCAQDQVCIHDTAGTLMCQVLPCVDSNVNCPVGYQCLPADPGLPLGDRVCRAMGCSPSCPSGSTCGNSGFCVSTCIPDYKSKACGQPDNCEHTSYVDSCGQGQFCAPVQTGYTCKPCTVDDHCGPNCIQCDDLMQCEPSKNACGQAAYLINCPYHPTTNAVSFGMGANCPNGAMLVHGGTGQRAWTYCFNFVALPMDKGLLGNNHHPESGSPGITHVSFSKSSGTPNILVTAGSYVNSPAGPHFYLWNINSQGTPINGAAGDGFFAATFGKEEMAALTKAAGNVTLYSFDPSGNMKSSKAVFTDTSSRHFSAAMDRSMDDSLVAMGIGVGPGESCNIDTDCGFFAFYYNGSAFVQTDYGMRPNSSKIAAVEFDDSTTPPRLAVLYPESSSSTFLEIHDYDSTNKKWILDITNMRRSIPLINAASVKFIQGTSLVVVSGMLTNIGETQVVIEAPVNGQMKVLGHFHDAQCPCMGGLDFIDMVDGGENHFRWLACAGSQKVCLWEFDWMLQRVTLMP